MPPTFTSFAHTLTVLDLSNPFQMTLRGAVTSQGQPEAAGIMAISLPDCAAIESFGFTGNVAYGEVHALLIRNALAPGGAFEIIADRQFTATTRQDVNKFDPVSPAHVVDNSSFTYLIEATAVARNVPAGQQFDATIYGFGMLLNV
jgi:hypothetical protein